VGKREGFGKRREKNKNEGKRRHPRFENYLLYLFILISL